MTDHKINDLTPGFKNVTMEMKVYRKWIAKTIPKLVPISCCCILLDTEGSAVQAHMDLKDADYFNSVLKTGNAYRFSKFSCEPTSTLQQTVPTPVTLRFGKYTNFQTLPAEGFPNHHFNFISYNQLPTRLPREEGGKLIYPILTDYIGAIRNIGDPKKIALTNQVSCTLRKIDIENLNGDCIELAMWENMAEEFDKEGISKMEQPVIIAISSCRVKKNKEFPIQLSATPATHYYLNPDIPEYELAQDEYKAIFNKHPPLPINKERYEDKEQEKIRNRFSLKTLLEQNPETLKNIKFTCEGTITWIDTTKEWHYLACNSCSKKLISNIDQFKCIEHGTEQNPTYRYNIKATIADDTASATFTFFSPNADKLIGMTCTDLVKMQSTAGINEVFKKLGETEGQVHIFQFHFNPTSTQNTITFNIDDILDLNDFPLNDPSTNKLHNSSQNTKNQTKGKEPKDEKHQKNTKRALFHQPENYKKHRAN